MLLLLWLLGGNPAQAQTRIMYLDPETEIRISVLCKRMDLGLSVLRIGVSDNGGRKFGLIRLQTQGEPRYRVRRAALRLVDRLFREFPDLIQLDLVGVDRPETRKRKPEVLFSLSVHRDRLAAVDRTRSPGVQLAATGEVWFRPGGPEDPEAVPLILPAVLQAVRSGAAQRRTSPEGS